MATDDLPRLLSDFRPAPGVLKADYSDFVVEELPLYDADGTGTHTYFLLEKQGLGTMQAVNDIAKALGVLRREIGYAGLKDSRAVTRQWMSVEHVPAEKIEALELPRLTIRKVTHHRNKLKLGHLRANAFTIRVRETEPDRLAELQDALAELARRGVPNYFGQQRFGDRGDNAAIGRALLLNEAEEAIDLLLGRPGPDDYGKVRHARELYEAGHFAEAISQWPPMFRDQRQALKALAQTKGKKRRALAAVDRNTRQFHVSAYQSYMFNRVLAARLESGLDRLQTGDLAWIHRNGAVFHVDDADADQPRADAFEISPTGPLFGGRMSAPSGAPGELEQRVLADEALPEGVFANPKLRVRGGRRPLRFQPTDTSIRLGADRRGVYLEFAFTLPRGCYATALLRELFVDQAVAAADGEGTDPSAE